MPSEALSRKLIKLRSKLLVLLDAEQQLRQETEAKLREAEMMIDPREQFNRWLRTKEGQKWKAMQFKYQAGRCAYCHEPLRKQDAVVHHIKPLAHFGSVANTPENFRLLHPRCNLEIGTKVIDFS